MSLERLETIASEFRSIEDIDLKGEMLIEYAENFKEVPERVSKRPFPKENLVPGCESQVYIWKEVLVNNFLQFHFAVENPQGVSAKALASILQSNLDNVSKEDASRLSENIVYDLFGKNISMGKGHGLLSMVRMINFLGKI